VALKKYKIKNTNILHDGVVRHIGEIIELDEKAATKLQDVLTLVKEVANKNQKPNDPEKTGGEDGK
jgi:hypothetical protein